MNLLQELKWRNLLNDYTPDTEKMLQENSINGYCGFDPTAESLHIGSLAPIMMLAHLQRAGHSPIALVGGATGMVGDPSGKSQERNLLDLDTLNKNIEGIKNQLSHFLDFDGPNKATLVNNFDWFKNFSFLDFIRDVGKHLTINYMMSKDSVKNRLETGMSFTEFSYQLLQGYDFYYLYKNMNCKLQMGGADQWGNMTTGMELIRRMGGGETNVITCPLVTKADGSKFGKSESGNIWLSPKLTSPFKFYQYWLNVADADAEKFLKIFTFLKEDEINALIEESKTNIRAAQKRLAQEVTTLVHGNEAFEKAKQASEELFSGNSIEKLGSYTEEEFLEIFEGVPSSFIQESTLKEGINILNFVTEIGCIASKSKAKEAVTAGAVKINREKITDLNKMITTENLINQKYILVQNGKKNNFLVIIAS